jgi:hypothetical protein
MGYIKSKSSWLKLTRELKGNEKFFGDTVGIEIYL